MSQKKLTYDTKIVANRVLNVVPMPGIDIIYYDIRPLNGKPISVFLPSETIYQDNKDYQFCFIAPNGTLLVIYNKAGKEETRKVCKNNLIEAQYNIEEKDWDFNELKGNGNFTVDPVEDSIEEIEIEFLGD